MQLMAAEWTSTSRATTSAARASGLVLPRLPGDGGLFEGREMSGQAASAHFEPLLTMRT